MEGEMTSRRTFLQGGTLATAGFVAGHAAEGVQEHPHGHGGHGEPGDYPRDRPGRGGPVGSPTDRGRLVPGLIKAGEPPVRVIVASLRIPISSRSVPATPGPCSEGRTRYDAIP
jgi:manganese oxidase